MATGELGLIRDLAVVLVAAAITGLLFHRLRIPLVLGYLAAGVLIGPNLSPIQLVGGSANGGGLEEIEVLAQIGVLFLLFSLGLDFHLGKLRRVGGVALAAGTLEVSLMVGVGFGVASLFGWSRIDALFLGAMLAISSTTIIVKVLGELGQLKRSSTQAIFGILLVEDLVAVILIALLSSLSLTGAVSIAAVGDLLLRVVVFVIAALIMGIVVVPRVVDHVAKLRVDELLLLFAVGIAFATSMIAVALGLSIALGAFIAGAIVAESRASTTVERRIAPLRDVFTAVFFVTTGILIDPADIITYWPAIAILAVVTVLGKMAAVGFATFIAGYPPREAMRVGIGMAMIGEFSFVIASVGAEGGVTSGFLLPIAVAVSAATAIITPPIIRNADSILTFGSRYLPRPIYNFTRMYTAWLGRARTRNHTGEAEPLHGRYDLDALLRAGSYAAVLVASAVVARFANVYLATALGSAGLVAAVVFGSWLLLAIPVFIGLARAVRELVDNIVFVIIPPRLMGAERGQAAAAVLRNAMYAFLAVLVALVGIAAGAAFFPPLPLLIGALVVVGIAAVVLRGSLHRLNTQLEHAVDVVFQSDTPAGERDAVLSLIRERYPWDMHVESLIVPSGSRAAHRRIRDLQLPQRTGASIVMHERDGTQTVNPAPDIIILPGDTIGLLGEHQQVEDATRMLAEESPTQERPIGTTHEGIQIEELDVTAASPLAGLTLAGSRIRERTGASIVGLRREGTPILNPAPVLRLQAGDTVVILGSHAQVNAARRMIAGTTE